MPNISFIIPTYNNKALLQRCLFSILSEIETNDEIIIVDDGSTDNTYDYISNKYGAIKNLLLVKQKNSGSGAARNNGLKHSTKEYVWFVDSDDFIVSGSLQKIKKKLISKNIDMLFFDFYRDEISNKKRQNININIYDKNSMFMSFHVPWNKIIRRTLFEDIYFPEGRIRYQDHGTIPIIISISTRFSYLKKPLYVYNDDNPDNISKKQNKNDDIYSAFQNLINYYHKDMLKREEIELLFIYTFIYSQIYNSPSNSFKDIYLNIKKVKKYLDKSYSDWRNSIYLNYSYMKKYNKTVDKLSLKIIIGNITRYNALIPTLLILIYKKLR